MKKPKKTLTKLMDKMSPKYATRSVPEEIKDVVVPDPIPGSPFTRRSMVECVIDTETLTKGKLYRIEEFGSIDDYLLIQDDSRQVIEYPSKYFRDISHGPFKVYDVVQINNLEGLMEDGKALIADYMSVNFYVKEVEQNRSLIEFSDFKIWCPNNQLNFIKRTKMFGDVTFKKGDTVKAIKTTLGRGPNIQAGDIFVISGIKGDAISVEGISSEYTFYPCHFVKYNRKVKKVAAKKKHLIDYVREHINQNPYEKINPLKIHKDLKHKAIIGDDITVNDIGKLTKILFKW